MPTFKVLRVNLTNGAISKEEVDGHVVEKFVGGRGLGAYFLLRELKAGVDPLSPENKLIFMAGIATGTAFPASSRCHVVTKSPLGGGLGDSSFGGFFAPELRFAGFEGIIIEGASPNPVYLWIHDGDAELKEASKYWGNGIWETTKAIIKELKDPDIRVACIGPTGENLCLYACIASPSIKRGEKIGVAGRTGTGAVMGSKKLKAIAVRGTERPKVARPEELDELVKNILKKIRESKITGISLPTYGTPALVSIVNAHGAFPAYNFKTGVFIDAEKISGETIREKSLVGKATCWGCPVACGRITRSTKIPYQFEGEGPQYETVWSLGAECGISDLDAVLKAHHLCTELGMDAISFGVTVGCAMELYERGKLTKEMLNGIELRWGNDQAIIELAWRTAYKIGFGSEIALGSKRLAEKYGEPDLAIHVKGLELPAYDPRGSIGMGLNYATSNRGACHLRGHMSILEVVGFPVKLDPLVSEGKAQWVKKLQDWFAVVDSLVVCKFVGTRAMTIEDYPPLINAITGWDWTVEDFLGTGERIYNLERLFINREGFDYKDDTLPKRLLEEPMPEGPAKGSIVPLEEMLEDYYELRGWKNGIPTLEKLRELELESLAKNYTRLF